MNKFCDLGGSQNLFMKNKKVTKNNEEMIR